MPSGVILTKAELRGDEQWHGRRLRDAFDSGGATHARSVLERFEFKVNTTLFCDSAAARGIGQRAGLGKVKALAVKTLWLQATVRDRGLQIKSVSSKANKADLRRKVHLWPG